MDVVFLVCIVMRGALGARVWDQCDVSSSKQVLCVCVLCASSEQFSSAAFCMTCSLLMLFLYVGS